MNIARFLVLLAILAMIIGFVCAAQPPTERPALHDVVTIARIREDGPVGIDIANIRGHEYAVFRYIGGGISVLHAASCPCMKPHPARDDKTLPPGAHILIDGKKPPAKKDGEK